MGTGSLSLGRGRCLVSTLRDRGDRRPEHTPWAACGDMGTRRGWPASDSRRVGNNIVTSLRLALRSVLEQLRSELERLLFL